MSLNKEPIGELATLVADRRRPGRLASVSPELIPILRGEEAVDLESDQLDLAEDDNLYEARGVLMGVALSAPLWLGVGFVGQWLFA